MNSKEEKIKNFDPSAIGQVNGGIYGFPFTAEESDYIIIPVPWETTVSFGGGTKNGAHAIFEASPQLDFYFPDFPDVWKKGIAMLDIPKRLWDMTVTSRKKVEEQIELMEQGLPVDIQMIEGINLACSQMNDWIFDRVKEVKQQGKTPILVGGDHSTPLGYLNYLSSKETFGILHIDAHFDLRKAYEGFEYSHASIMYNALKNDRITKLVSVGIRDYCAEEVKYVEQSNGRVVPFYDATMKSDLYQGKTWDAICDAIIYALPEQVYISVDIDGLNPSLCPETGTPVPGGLEYQELIYLLKKLSESGKKIIGADLVEVGDADWDANVGARVLYNLIGYMDLTL